MAKPPKESKARARLRLVGAAEPPPPTADDATVWPPGFAMRDDGLYRLARDQGERDKWLCGPFAVIAEARDPAGEGWGLLLAWNDHDGRPHRWVMPAAALAGDGGEARAKLLHGGLRIAAGQGARAALTECLARVRSENKAITLARVGWHLPPDGGAAFLLPGRTLGAPPPGETLHLDLDPPPAVYRARGTLPEWQGRVAALCIGNSRLVFMLSAAFAGPLLTPLGEEAGGVHLRGDSATGKTTTLHVAASVWGAPIGFASFVRQWRATGNALEAVASAHNDTLLPLDELGQADPREIGEVAYMLANGAGKERLRDRGGLRRPASWRVLFASTGEEGLADLLRRAGRPVKAGQAVRVLDVPADAGAGRGVFEELHDEASGDAFARLLREACAAQHGTAGPAFLAELTPLVGRPGWIEEVARPRLRAAAADLIPAEADGQVVRAAGRFALIGFAGELAAELGVLPWPSGTAAAAARICFRAWLALRGGTGGHEAMALLAFLRRFIQAHGAARFETLHDDEHEDEHEDAMLAEAAPPDPRTMLRVGWKWTKQARISDGRIRRCWHYGFALETFAAEVCEPLGLHPREARAKLAAAGVIDTEAGGGEVRTTVRRRVPGHGRPRLVVVLPALFDGADEGTAD